MAPEKKELIDFLFGWGDKQRNKEIAQELREHPDGEIAQFFKMVQQRARNALNVDWRRVEGKEAGEHNGVEG